jgi:hypothetical protein
LVVQSEATAQASPTAHGGQVPPPQSTSVSFPFFFESMQVGSLQTLPRQLLLLQSPSVRQFFRSAQVGQVPPPQSTSVSFPFFIPSVQLDPPELDEELAAVLLDEEALVLLLDVLVPLDVPDVLALLDVVAVLPPVPSYLRGSAEHAEIMATVEAKRAHHGRLTIRVLTMALSSMTARAADRYRHTQRYLRLSNAFTQRAGRLSVDGLEDPQKSDQGRGTMARAAGSAGWTPFRDARRRARSMRRAIARTRSSRGSERATESGR